MSIDDPIGPELRRRLDELLTPQLAQELVDAMTDRRPDDVTKPMLDQQTALLRAEMAEQGAQLRAAIAEQVDAIRELRTEFSVALHDNLGQVYLELTKHTRTIMIGIIAMTVTLVAAMTANLQL